MLFKINQRSSTPIYQQLIQEIKVAVLKNILQPGDKLPSVRDLAMQLTINPNTIQKAYQELERQKVIETLRGKGTFVSSYYQPNKDEERMIDLKENLTNILVEARFLGLNYEKIMQLVQEILTELNVKEEKNH